MARINDAGQLPQFSVDAVNVSLPVTQNYSVDKQIELFNLGQPYLRNDVVRHEFSELVTPEKALSKPAFSYTKIKLGISTQTETPGLGN